MHSNIFGILYRIKYKDGIVDKDVVVDLKGLIKIVKKEGGKKW